MDHEQIRELIHSYADGELDAANARVVSEHIRGCDECRALERRITSLRTAMATSAPAYRAPASLRRHVRAALRREAKGEGYSPWLVFATGAACALLLVTTALMTMRGSTNAIADQVVSNHVRSLLAAHLVDVPSSDQHTVKPWFDGKVDFAPQVVDLTSKGFPLIGGRLDYLDGKTVVALVYHRNKHPINVFIMPNESGRDRPASTSVRRGYNLVHWRRGEMEYWAVSDLNAIELGELAAELSK